MATHGDFLHDNLQEQNFQSDSYTSSSLNSRVSVESVNMRASSKAPNLIDYNVRSSSPALLKRGFLWFAVIASLNHALNYVVNSYATTLLSAKLGGICLGLNWILNAVSGLTIATPIVRIFGFKYAMIISFWGYAFQIATLYVAVVNPSIAW